MSLRAITSFPWSPTTKKVAFLAASAAVLLFFAYGVYRDWGELSTHQWSINYSYLAFSLLLYGLIFFLNIWVWSSIAARLCQVTSFSRNLQAYCQANLAARLPGPLWHVGARVYLYQKEGVGRSFTLVGTFLELALKIASGVLISLVTLPFYVGETSLLPRYRTPTLMGLSLLLLISPLLLKKGVPLLTARLAGEETVLDLRDTLLWSAEYSLCWLLGGLMLYWVANVVYPLPPTYAPTVIHIATTSVTLATVASLLPGGLLVREVSISVLLSRFVPLSMAIVISLLSRLLVTVADVFYSLASLALNRYLLTGSGAGTGGPDSKVDL